MRAATLTAILIVVLRNSNAECPGAGDSKEARIQELDLLKNRAIAPVNRRSGSDIDNSITLAAMLKPGEDSKRFNTGQAATITGYVALVKDGGAESCNCHSKTNRDTHIAIVQTKADAAHPNRHVIVEVTPHFRGLGDTSALRKTLVGHKVQITGWMFFDAEHAQNAANTTGNKTAPPASVWRATCWELHPVTAIKILDQSPLARIKSPFPPKTYPPDRWQGEFDEGKIDINEYRSLTAGELDLLRWPWIQKPAARPRS